jgi:FtsP/CotA-like multicopper oxidase with cupredoxin domain
LLTGVTDTVGTVTFTNQLAIPPLAASHVDGSGARVFDLNVTAGHHQFGSGQSADTLGYNGDYLGPTLRTSQGEQVIVNVHNGLNESTTVHWHGMHLPAVMDGGPHQLIPAGTDWRPTWKINQPAATLWYHPHPHGATAKQVYQGLAGFFILDDPQTTALNLPQQYGVDDLPLVVQDKAFDGRTGLDDSNSFLSGNGILGNQIVVNGTLDPYVDVTTELVRLRLLNGSNARTFDFGFDDDRSFAISPRTAAC